VFCPALLSHYANVPHVREAMSSIVLPVRAVEYDAAQAAVARRQEPARQAAEAAAARVRA
jgi:hypothetical protein